MERLAVKGGRPVRDRPFPACVTIGEEEKRAVLGVLESTVLSRFLAVWGPDYLGGPQVRALEAEWASRFGARHAVSVNSATSGLYAAVGAAGVGPGDEVIVSPYTMTASATAALIYGGIPVFADIDPETFCISPDTIAARLTPRTRAVIAVDLFGHPADMDGIMDLARDHDLTVIEDAAQAPGASLNGKPAGTLAHLGVFSLNYHKTIHCGEGGMVVTDDPALAERVQMIRNHAEVAVKARGVKDLVNMVGWNYRMTEIEAAIAREQLKKLDRLVAARQEAAAYLTGRLEGTRGLLPPRVRPGVKHGYYLYAMRYTGAGSGIPREKVVAALVAEGIPVVNGYVEPIYLQPLYQQRIAFGRDGFPFTYPGYTGTVDYRKGICPVTERMYYDELMYTGVCHAQVTREDLDDVAGGFQKVFGALEEL
ncbi:MAG: DegT/DnrJ/EryC1/StrS family aminotransferase [Methanomicrobiales archaeon]|nr:DegT/DnrJ/EryC1/StrS family aminotransferase [Methanomicrobiales archaeon]